MTGLLLAVLVAGFTGSLHCAAMCGPFAALSRHQPAYAAGRLGAYLALGAAAGAVGAAVDLAGELASVGPVAMLVAGIALLAWGSLSLARALGWRRRGGAAAGPTAPMLYAIKRRRRSTRAALIGALSVLLPCGWLWAFVIVAAGTGGPWSGAAVMAALWLGSAPALAGAGAAMHALAGRLGPRLPILTASLQIAIGATALAIRAPMLDAPAPHPAGAEAPAVPSEASCH
jgi:sulfite exporter TauE/SafE